jgi:putative ABC transport system substrate-binding protein
MRRFIQALRDLGWRNGADLQIDVRWAGEIADMTTGAKELVALQPDLIHVTTGLATAEILKQTLTIPVVFSVVNDPVESGFVQSLQRPGGNATGFTNIDPSLGVRWMGLLKDIAPRITRAAMVFNPSDEKMDKRWDFLKTAAEPLGITLEAAPVQNTAELETTIAALGRDPQAGLIVIPGSFIRSNHALITSLAARHRVVAIYPTVDFVKAGGLASYAVDLPDLQRRAAGYADRILKGETPAALPVLPPEKFELLINLNVAKALGLTVPPALLARATEVIKVIE